ncbi:MAG: MCP four helix bundle domain-containing protein [Verrucomicrobiales bacterium]|nr:MCP four helix bundle domain-containing protein [Verrucomicrobiales bacterium]
MRSTSFALRFSSVLGLAFLACAIPVRTCASTEPAAEPYQFLIQGNQRFVAGTAQHPGQDGVRRTEVAKGQHPQAVVITCADSRVSPEILFDQGLGDLFVIRVAGAVANTDQVGSIEYGVEHLKAPLLVVMGHSQCGAVAAVVRGDPVEGNIPDAVKNIGPVVRRVKAAQGGAAVDALVAASIEANTWQTVDDIFQASPMVREMVASGKLQVVGALYDLSSGSVKWLGAHPEQARMLTYTSGPVAHGEEGHAAEKVAAVAGASAKTTVEAVVKEASAPEKTVTAEVASHAWIWMAGTLVGVALLMGLSGVAIRSSWVRRWTVPVRLTAGFGAILAVLTGLGWIAVIELKSTKAGFEEFGKDADLSEVAGNLNASYMDMELATRNWLLHTSDASIKQFETSLGEFNKDLKTLVESVEEPHRQEKVRNLQRHVAEYTPVFGQMCALAVAGRMAEAVAMQSKLQTLGSALDAETAGLMHEFNEDQEIAEPIIHQRIADAQVGLVSVMLGAVVLGFFLSWLISRSVTAPLRQLADGLSAGAEQTATASGQVAAASQTLAEGASEQAASLEETSASLEEITSMVARNAGAAKNANELTHQTSAAADEGVSTMGELQGAMGEIKGSSDEVAKIVKSIDEIAFQTNILALNAAVEAARAGESGAGFAVVADEVRSLAQRSAQAAKETATLIDAAITKSQRGFQISEKVAADLNQIVSKIREVDRYVSEIASASNEQSEGIRQVATAVTQMDKVIQSNAASAEESASASEELSSQAKTVEEAVSALRALVGGSARRGVRPPEIRSAVRTSKPKAPALREAHSVAIKAAPAPKSGTAPAHRTTTPAVQDPLTF